MTTYRYLFADLLTDAVHCELPLTNVSFSRELNVPGSLSGTLMLSDLREIVYDIDTCTTPGRTSLYVERDSTLVWGGIVWGRSYDSSSQSMSFQAREFESYFEKRRITTTYSASATDQLQVAKALVDQIQAVPSGNINVQVPTLFSGILITKTYNDYELKPLNEALYELSRQQYGFDWNIDVSYDVNYNFVKTLDLGYPRRGTAYSSAATIPVLEFPGNVIAYTFPEEGGSIANTMYGIGNGTGDDALRSTRNNAVQLVDGWPVLEASVSLTDYTDQTLLDQITEANLNAVINPVVVLQMVTEAYNEPILGSFKTGDDVRVIINDPRWPDGLDVVRRLAKFEVQPGEAGPERITWSLVVTPN